MAQTEGRLSTHLANWGILVVVVAGLTWMSWEAWGEPIIDFGREVYVPWQLREGRALYRDLIYNYGPIAPYLLAAWTAIAGDTLAAYAAAGGIIGLVTMAGVYALGCRLGSVRAGLGASILFAIHSFFGHSTWGANYVMPYAYAATLSMALAVWSFHALLGYLFHGRRRRDLYIGAGLMLGAVLSKQEVGLAIAATWVVAAIVHRVGWRDVGIVTGLSAGVIGVFVMLAAGRPGEHALLADNLFRFAGAATTHFFQDVAGIGRWRFNLTDVSAYRIALPLAGLALLLAGRSSALWLLAVFVLFCAPRIGLAFDPAWYGFYLFVPAYLLLTFGLGVWLGRWRVVTVAFAALAVVIAGHYVGLSWATYRGKTQVLSTAKGVMRDRVPGRAAAIQEFVDYMASAALPAETLVVLPEGAALNWWTGLRNPMSFYSFIPPEFTDATVLPRMLSEIRASRPTWISVVSRPLDEFGVQDLGYCRELVDYIGDNYAVARTFGDDQAWRILLLKRKL